MTGVIFDIQRFAVHDGPGIRTTIFFKGCSARCGWCHNPESLSALRQLRYYPERCTGCGKCAVLCPSGAHSMGADGHVFNREPCTGCGFCADECFSNALESSGREETADEVLRQALEDAPYYEQSGGGVTLSGGEPVLQADFCESLLKGLKEKSIHTCLQTAGFYRFERLEKLLPYLDLVMYDVKGFSPAVYEEHIHADRNLALENLRRLDEWDIPIIARTPCVGGVNDSSKEIESIAEMLADIKHLREYRIIPYHGLAKVKYDALGQPFTAYETPSNERIQALEEIAASVYERENKAALGCLSGF